METKLISPKKNIYPPEPFPWLNATPAGPPPNQHMIIVKITPAIFQEALYQLPNHKASGPENIPGVLLKHMYQTLHNAIYQLFQLMAATGTTPPHCLLSNTILFYKKHAPLT
jgi:hypothetical protein